MMTKLLVLAILDMKAMSGYDIQQMMQTTDAQRWGAVQVYLSCSKEIRA